MDGAQFWKHNKTPPAQRGIESIPRMWPNRKELCLRNLAGLDAAGAHADPLGSAVDQCLDGLQVNVPAAFRYIVCVRDVVAKLRTFAANVAYLCHC